jgi:glycosyltransferase involved in cell wall biosynthesis
MRILYALTAYKPAWRVGGPVLSVSDAAEALVGKGHRVTVFCSNSNLDRDLDVPVDRPLDVDGVEVWYCRREEPMQKWLPFVPYLARSIGFMYCPAMRAALDRTMPSIDVVDTHMPFVYPSYAAARAAFRHRRPLVYHQRGNFDPARLRFRPWKKRLYIDLIERPIMRRATILVGLTEAERASFRALGVRTPVEVVPNGVRLPDERPGAGERVQRRWGIAPGAPLVLFMGRLHPTKGAERLLAAFARVQERLPGAVLVMAGPDEWKLQAAWNARLAQGALAGRVHFPGMLTGDDKADMLARADLFALPSLGEGFSMAVLEALAARTAVMLSPGCHFPEVDEAGCGVTVAADEAAMGAALVDLLERPDRLRAMGAAGRRLVAARYSWDAITDRLLSVYERAITVEHAAAAR